MAEDQLTQGELFGEILPGLVRGGRRSFVNIAGQPFDSLEAVAYVGHGVGGAYWRCRCKCGGEVIATYSQLKRRAIVRCPRCRKPTEKPAEKQCRKCQRVLPFDAEHFVVSNQHPFGLRAVCKPCNAPYVNRIARERHREVRIEVLSHYSGGQPRCACCGETVFEFLALDHLEGGSAEDYRKHGGSGHRLLMAVRRDGFPPRFRVLCHNCNLCCKNYGYCVHDPERIKFHKPLTRVPQSAFTDMRKRYRESVRMKTLIRYSTNPPRCSCCGVDRVEFLSIEHLVGGGNEHSRQRSGSKICVWLMARGFPDGYGVLCYNCNLAKGFYGVCPHSLGTQP